MNNNLSKQFNTKGKKPQHWVLICYGNILRSQVLEQYLRYYSKRQNSDIEFYSVGIADWEEFPDTQILLEEVRKELKKRNIPCSLERKSWSDEATKKIQSADIILFADNGVKDTVFERMDNKINKETAYTFYEMISEGEKNFEDTYDYENNRQDPVRFRHAFDELDRISRKICIPSN